jgi:hypothetical protein
MQNGMVEWSELTKYQAGTLLPQAHGNGKEVLIQQCFNCHAFGKIGAVGRHDLQGWKDEIDVMRQTGVARVRPELRDEVAAYLAAAFGPETATPESPAELPGYQNVKQDREHFSDEALNIVYVDYQLTGDPRDRPGSARPDKNGYLWMEMAGGLSRLNPDTGEIKTWRLSEFNNAFIHEILPTDDGSVWLTLEREGGLARFNTRTEKFEVFIDQKMIDDYNVAKPVQKDPNDPFPNLPDARGPQGGGARSHTAAIDHDGNVWVSGRPLKKLDARTGRYNSTIRKRRTATASPSTRRATCGSRSSMRATTRTSAWSTPRRRRSPCSRRRPACRRDVSRSIPRAWCGSAIISAAA